MGNDSTIVQPQGRLILFWLFGNIHFNIHQYNVWVSEAECKYVYVFGACFI